MKRINIMTSCDDNLALNIMPQLASISVNMPGYDVHFYLFHYRIRPENVKAVEEYAVQTGITFHETVIQNVNEFELLAKYGGRYPPEAYAYLNCHDYFSADIERVLYIDAGDVIIHGDISEYYFGDFEGKSFIVTPDTVAVTENGKARLFDSSDLQNPEHIEILRNSHINSGCIVLNLEKLRTNGNRLMTHYQKIIKTVSDMNLEPPQGVHGALYLGDQGIMGLAFVGDMAFFGYESVIKNVLFSYPCIRSPKHLENMYKPFNFVQAGCVVDAGRELVPVVLHYASPLPRPWNKKYSETDIGNLELDELSEITKTRGGIRPEHIHLHNIWWEYAGDKPFSLSPSNREKNPSKINRLLYMAEYHLAHTDYEEAKKFIEKGLDGATKECDTFHVFWQLKIRAILENDSDRMRYDKTVKAINGYLQITFPAYMTINMYHYKGFCHRRMEEYGDAISAYSESDKLMKAAEKGTIDAGKGVVYFPVNPTLPIVGKWMNIYSHTHDHLIDSDDAKRRVLRSREILTASDNARCISECYRCLKDYDNAFEWASRISLKGEADAIFYFELMNESGQTHRVAEFFKRIAALRDDKRKHNAMDECFVVFEEVLLPQPSVVSILSPVFDEYIIHTYDFVNRKNPESNAVHRMAYNLYLSDKLYDEGNKAAAFEYFKRAFDADERFAPLMTKRLERFV